MHIPKYTIQINHTPVVIECNYLKWVKLWFAFSQHLTFVVKGFISGINLITVCNVFQSSKSFMEKADCLNLDLHCGILQLPFTVFFVTVVLSCLWIILCLEKRLCGQQADKF